MDGFMQKIQDRPINSKYSLVRRLGAGGFGAVYIGKDLDTGQEVAMKLEHRSGDFVLMMEAELYKGFSGLHGFPELYWYGQHDDYDVMVLELLGPSLADVFVFCGCQFTLKTTLMIMDQLLFRFEALHSQRVVHRDIKPENFLLGSGRNGNIVYMADFGCSRDYTVEERDNDVRLPTRPHPVGTTRYASIRGHRGQVQSPRDDLEALGYMVIYFMRGSLPWQGLNVDDFLEKSQLVLEKKLDASAEELCLGLAEEFAQYMRYVQSLKQWEQPDYPWLRSLFRNAAKENGIAYDNVFDWTVRMYHLREEGKAIA